MKLARNIVLLFLFIGLENWAYAQTFTNVAPSQGLNIFPSTIIINGAGVSFYDFNNDGWDDLSFVMEDSAHAIYINNMGNFQEASFTLPNFGQAKELLWVDYDNDGVLDVFVSKYNAPNQLFKNDGNFNFTDVTVSAGLSNVDDLSWGSSFGDYNKDGYLDLYVCKYHLGSGDSTNLVQVNNLYRNNRNGTFTDVTFSAGVADGLKASFCAVWFDYNNDTWPDLYVVNDRTYDGTLFKNNGNNTFTDVTVSANVTAILSNLMSGSVTDYDNDGDLDLFVSNTSGTTGLPTPAYDLPLLFNNQGDGTFLDLAIAQNLYMENSTWGGVWIDYDNDGNQDLYVATDYLDPNFQNVNSYFFRNTGLGNFVEDTSVFVGNQKGPSFAVARGDFDNNGFYDIVVQNENLVAPFLLENSGNINNYVKITLEGTVSNKFAIGSWIKVYADGKVQSQYTLCSDNYIAQNSQHHIFGVGSATIIDSISVEYSIGIVDKYYNLPVNQNYDFVEGETSRVFNITNMGDSILCFGDNTSLIAPLFDDYLWNTGDTSQQIQVWESGSYFLESIDSNSLVYTSDTVVIEVLSAVEIFKIVDNVSCTDAEDGALYLDVVNDGSAYSINWLHGGFGDSLFNLPVGTYTFNYLDSVGCSYQDSAVVAEPFPLNVQLSIIDETPSSIGELTLLVNGGVAPYQIYIDSVLILNNNASLSAGNYLIEVIDANECYWSSEFEVLYEDTAIQTATFDVEDLNLTIYPIPIKQDFTISFNSNYPENYQLSVFDLLGNLIFSESFFSVSGMNYKNFKLPEELSKGCYVMDLTSGQSTYAQMILKE